YISGTASAIHDPLYARALAMSDGGKTVVMVEMDLIMVNGYMSNEIKQEIEKRTGIPPQNVTLTAVHTHTGPEGYYEEFGKYPRIVDLKMKMKIEDATVAAVEAAVKAMIPAEAGSAYIDMTGLAHNRHSGDPIDNRGLLLLVRDAKSRNLIGGFINFASHGIIAPAEQGMISADWSEVMNGIIDKKMNGGYFLFLQGAEGNVTPAGYDGKGWEGVADYGAKVANTVLKQFDKVTEFTSDFPVDGRLEELVFPVKTSKKLTEFKKSIKEKTEEYKKSSLTPDEQNARIRWMNDRANIEAFIIPMFKTMKRIKNGETHTWAQSIRLGDTLLVAFPGEAITELAFKVREDLAPKKVVVLSLTNDHLAYLTTQKVFDEGGYEAGMSFVYPDSAMKITEALEKQAKELEN
ncbi:MAG: neutral/alkaline non-lysosomal ceramidase N-terminal domain-containing protein, partial [bacterium]